MKKLTAVLIIIICMAAFAMPVIAGKEDKGVHVGITIAAATTPTSSSGEPEQRHGIDDSKSPPGRNISQVQEDNRKDREELNATLRNVSSDQRERIRNQNEVRLAVHSLLEMENLSGGIGREVSAIARDFNNSASSARVLEDRIQTRNSIIRLFFGGDQDAAGELTNLTARNQARIQQLQQLINSTSLDTDVQTAMEEQVQILQNEEVRLEQLAARERQDRGLFGWLGK